MELVYYCLKNHLVLEKTNRILTFLETGVIRVARRDPIEGAKPKVLILKKLQKLFSTRSLNVTKSRQALNRPFLFGTVFLDTLLVKPASRCSRIEPTAIALGDPKWNDEVLCKIATISMLSVMMKPFVFRHNSQRKS